MHKLIMFPLLLLLSSWSYGQDDFVGIGYTFGSATVAPPVEILLLGKDFGAVQLLKDGMHVRFYYLLEADRRVIKVLLEIAESTEI
jgi:hypothetical protein